MRRQLVYSVVACLVCFVAGMFAQSAAEPTSYQSRPNGTRLDVLFDGPTMGVEPAGEPVLHSAAAAVAAASDGPSASAAAER